MKYYIYCYIYKDNTFTMLPNYSYSPSNHFHLPNTPRFHGSHHTKPSVPVSVPYPHLYPIQHLYSHSPIHNSTNPVDKYG